MRSVRPAIAAHPQSFGRRTAHPAGPVTHAGLADDLRLFATTFVAGFLFVFLLIA